MPSFRAGGKGRPDYEDLLELPQHGLEDAAVLEVADLVRGVEADGRLEGDRVAAVASRLGGFLLGSSDSNTLMENAASDNGGRGFGLVGSNANTLTKNAASGNAFAGFRLDSSNSNALTGNAASGERCT